MFFYFLHASANIDSLQQSIQMTTEAWHSSNARLDGLQKDINECGSNEHERKNFLLERLHKEANNGQAIFDRLADLRDELKKVKESR